MGEWKETCEQTGTNFATLPKQEFPKILAQLLEKDFGDSIRSGFESTGLYPVDVRRALTKLPQEDREIESAVQQKLLDRLSELRYNPVPTTRAKRPLKKDKIPAGAAYTCAANQAEGSSSEESEDSGDSVDSEDSETEKRENIQAILKRLKGKKKTLDLEKQQKKIIEQEEEDDVEEVDIERELTEEGENNSKLPEGEKTNNETELCQAYQDGAYVVAIYLNNWYVGQVLGKEDGSLDTEQEQYILINFMMRTTGDVLKWPAEADILKMLKVSTGTYIFFCFTFTSIFYQMLESCWYLYRYWYRTYFTGIFFSRLIFSSHVSRPHRQPPHRQAGVQILLSLPKI